MEALDIEQQSIQYNEAPIEATPGDYVLDSDALEELDPDILEFLLEHAEELSLRVGIPNKWDVALKPHREVGSEDDENVNVWRQEEVAYLQYMARYHLNIHALGSEHTTDPNAKTGYALEWRNGRWVPKLPKEEEG